MIRKWWIELLINEYSEEMNEWHINENFEENDEQMKKL